MDTTQANAIASHLRRHGSITPMEALRHYQCMRLAARIGELRQQHKIETVYETTRSGKRIARYVWSGRS